MDIVALVFYAVVCGVLGLVGPVLGNPITRLGIGAIVGIVAASCMPIIRTVLAS